MTSDSSDNISPNAVPTIPEPAKLDAETDLVIEAAIIAGIEWGELLDDDPTGPTVEAKIERAKSALVCRIRELVEEARKDGWINGFNMDPL